MLVFGLGMPFFEIRRRGPFSTTILFIPVQAHFFPLYPLYLTVWGSTIHGVRERVSVSLSF